MRGNAPGAKAVVRSRSYGPADKSVPARTRDADKESELDFQGRDKRELGADRDFTESHPRYAA